MPQMSPINWLNLFLFFMMMFYMLMNLLYFNFLKKNKINLNKNFNQTKNYNKLI